MALDPNRGAVQFAGKWHTWGAMSGLGGKVMCLLDDAHAGEGAAVGMLLSGRCIATISPFQSVTALAADLRKLRVPVRRVIRTCRV